MKNYVQPGETLTLTAPGDVAAGAGVMVGAIFGVAQHAALTGEPLVLVRRGVFTLPKINAQAWTVGARVYWNNATAALTTAASGNTLVGAAVEAAADPSATGMVVLDGAVR